MSIKLADMLDRVDAASARHRNVHNDNVRLLVFVALIGRRSVAGFTDDRYPFVLCKERTVAFANDGVVVDNKDSDCPPRAITRSLMPIRLIPLPRATMPPSAAPHPSFSIGSVIQRRSDVVGP